VTYSKVSDACIGPYRALVFDETPPDIIGFLAKIVQILAESKIPIMTYSTYCRDLVLVPSKDVEHAIKGINSKRVCISRIAVDHDLKHVLNFDNSRIYHCIRSSNVSL